MKYLAEMEILMLEVFKKSEEEDKNVSKK